MLHKVAQRISLTIASSVLLSSSILFAPTVHALDFNNQPQSSRSTEIDPSDMAAAAEPAIGRLVIKLSGKMTWKGDTYDVKSGVSGTGFFVNQKGYVATNRHVIEPANNPQESKELLAQSLAYQLADAGKISFLEVIYKPDFVKDLAKQAELSELLAP